MKHRRRTMLARRRRPREPLTFEKWQRTFRAPEGVGAAMWCRWFDENPHAYANILRECRLDRYLPLVTP